jgi:hypothetical protein
MRRFENIINFINQVFREETNKIILGRWTINYCPISIKKKIDSGNHDHCGPCGIKDKDEDDIIIKNKLNNNKDKLV